MRGSPRFLFAFLILCALPAAAQSEPAPASSNVPGVDFADASPLAADEGHATLAWDLLEGTATGTALRFELQQSPTPDFADDGRIRHNGTARAFFVSGLGEGDTWFRVRAVGADGEAGRWSQPLAVRVRYPAREHVVRLMLVGLVVFCATVAAIVAGWSSTRAGSG